MKTQKRLERRMNELESIYDHIGSYNIQHESWQLAVLKREMQYSA